MGCCWSLNSNIKEDSISDESFSVLESTMRINRIIDPNGAEMQQYNINEKFSWWGHPEAKKCYEIVDREFRGWFTTGKACSFDLPEHFITMTYMLERYSRHTDEVLFTW